MSDDFKNKVAKLIIMDRSQALRIDEYKLGWFDGFHEDIQAENNTPPYIQGYKAGAAISAAITWELM